MPKNMPMMGGMFGMSMPPPPPGMAQGMPMMGIPPMGMGMPPPVALGGQPLPSTSPATPTPPQDQSTDPFRFLQTAVSAAVQNQASAGSGTTARGPSQNLVSSIYNVLSKERDNNMENTAKLSKMTEENKKLQAKLQRRGEQLKERSALLSRLEYCLMKEGSKKNTGKMTEVTKQQKLNQTLAANKKLLMDIQTQTRALEKEKTAMDNRERDLIGREERLRKLAETLRKQQMDFQKRVDDQSAKAREAALAAANKKAPKAKVEVKYVKVPKIVYKPAPSGCEAINDCGTCAAHGGCGWCESGSQPRCLPSTNGTTAQCDEASWNFNFCKMQKCIEHVHCSSCMADPRCGMCANTGNCMKGTLTGPSQGTCSTWNYAIDLRFMSYNIYGRDLRNCSGRAQWIFKMIREGNADFVALQEVEDWFLEELAKQQWALEYHMSDFGSGHAPGGLLVLSKLPLESVSYFEKTDPGQIEVDQRARVLVVKPKMGSRNLAIATTTLDWRNSGNRAQSLDMVFSVVNSTSDVVLMGDFNFDQDAMPESSHVPSSYSDVWSRMHPTQKGYTWDPELNSYAKESDPTSQPSRVDRMLVKSDFWQPSKIDKIGCPEASPHYGLLSEMSMFQAYC